MQTATISGDERVALAPSRPLDATDGPVPSSAAPATPRPTARRVPAHRLLTPFALVAIVVSGAAVVGLHLLPRWGGVNPITGMLSDYGVGREGWVFNTALDVLAVGSAALLVKLALHRLVTGRVTVALLVAWCVGLIGIATFTKDPNLGTQTLRGSIHLYSTALACVSLPLGALAIGWCHRSHPRWRRLARTTQALAVASVPCFLPFLVSFFVIRLSHGHGLTAVPTGLVERLMGVDDLALLVVLAVWSHRAATPRAAAAPEVVAPRAPEVTSPRAPDVTSRRAPEVAEVAG